MTMEQLLSGSILSGQDNKDLVFSFLPEKETDLALWLCLRGMYPLPKQLTRLVIITNHAKMFTKLRSDVRVRGGGTLHIYLAYPLYLAWWRIAHRATSFTLRKHARRKKINCSIFV